MKQPKGETRNRFPFFYGWVVVGIAFICQVIVYGMRNSFAVFYVPILNEFEQSRADTALIFSINVGVYGLIGPLSGSFIDRFGPRKVMAVGVILLALSAMACSQASEIWHLYLLFGLVMAIGMSLAGFVPNVAILANWFVKRRGTAFGIFISGWGLSFFVTIVSQYLISIFGWRNSFLILGSGILVILMPLILIFHRHHPADMGLVPDGDTALAEDDAGNAVAATTASFVVDKEWAATEWTILKVLRNPRFWALFFANFLIWGIVETLLVAHQVACAVDAGFTATVAATMVTVFGVMVAVGVLGGGFLSDRLGRELTFSAGSMMAILAIVVLMLLGSSSPTWMLFLYGVTMGIGLGIDGPVLTAALADMFQGRNFGAINGLAVMGFGLAGAFSPWLGGFIFDITGDYGLIFPLLITATFLSIVLVWLAGPRRIRRVPGKASKSRLA